MTIYFIPTVQYRVKQYMTCQTCGTHYEIGDSLKQEIADRLMTETRLKGIIASMGPTTNKPVAKCQQCSEEILPNMRFCPYCGNTLA